MRIDVKDLAKKTFRAWSADKAPRLGAALAYYTALSIAPLILVVISVAGIAFGDEAARGQIVGQIRGLVGMDGAKAIEDMLANSRHESRGIIAAVIGTATLLIGASGVFGQLQDALNTIWHVEPDPTAGWKAYLKSRFVSLTMVFGVGFLLLVSLLLSAGIAAASQLLRSIGPGLEALGYALDLTLSIAVVSSLFAMIYKFLPDKDIEWSEVWVGGVATALLFVIGKAAVGLYLGHASVGSTYGAAGSFVVLLVWIYYSAQILLLGAEFTRVWSEETHPQRHRVADASRPEDGSARTPLTSLRT
jgi:membrane protein